MRSLAGHEDAIFAPAVEKQSCVDRVRADIQYLAEARTFAVRRLGGATSEETAMKIVPALALATFALMSSAYAAEMTGTVKQVDAMKHMIVLEDGMSVMTNDDVKLEGVKTGDKVKIMVDDNKMGTMVEKMN
jgi:hypothetical protein